MISVLIVDDHELLRAGLRSRLEREPGITVVGEADTAERAVVMARRLQPDLILLDLLLPRKSGYDAIPELADVAPQAKSPRRVVAGRAELGSACAVRRRRGIPSEALIRPGARGCDPARGGRRRLRRARSSAQSSSVPTAHRHSSRSPSERATSSICSRSATRTRRSRKKLFISVRTVDTHRAHIMRKLQLETRAELVMFALANGVIGPNVD